MGDDDAASRAEAERQEMEADRLAALGALDEARALYRRAQQILFPTGRMWADAAEHDLRMAGFQRIQEKIWALASAPASQRIAATAPEPSRAERRAERSARFGTSEAAMAFARSLHIGYAEWHDGVGYDLDALKAMTPAEQKAVEAAFAEKVASGAAGRREIEALAALNSEAARAALREALGAANPETRLHAATALKTLGETVPMDEVIVEVLRGGTFSRGVSYAFDLIPEHDSPVIRSALLDLARNGDRTVRAHAAAMLLYLAGLAAEPFDWNHRPFFLQFGEEDAETRERAFAGLKQHLAAAHRK
jgi:hypothetical protein